MIVDQSVSLMVDLYTNSGCMKVFIWQVPLHKLLKAKTSSAEREQGDFLNVVYFLREGQEIDNGWEFTASFEEGEILPYAVFSWFPCHPSCSIMAFFCSSDFNVVPCQRSR